MIVTKQSDELLEVPIGEILVNPDQPRRLFEEKEIEKLAQSIQAVGLIHPPIVRSLGKRGYELVAGERRYRACQFLGFSKLRVIVRSASRTESAEAALVENIQRVDLNPVEVALALDSLIREYGYAQEELGRRVGKKRSTIANYLRLLSLPESIQKSVQQRMISMGHAKVILSVSSSEKQLLLHELVLRDDLTVRQTEASMKVMTDRQTSKPKVYQTRDFYLEHLEGKLQSLLGTKVALKGSGTRGRMVIDYYTLDDLQNLLDRLGVSSDG
jgi:ParB family chromosome partitioning protein